MAAKPAPAPAPTPTNPCCAALQLRCSKLEEKRNALRQGCHILKDQLIRLEADNGALKKAYDEERARADLERNNKEKEIAFRIFVESKVAELESQLSSSQQAGSSQFEYFDKELKTLQEKISEREAEIDMLKQFLEEEKRSANVERENARMERQKAMELNDALEAQKYSAKETSNHFEAYGDSESNKATLLQYKELADENERKFTGEHLYGNSAVKQLEDETVKVELLQKEVRPLHSSDESTEARFAMQLSEKEAELNYFKDLLEVEKSRADLEQKKAGTLQETLELEKNKSLEYSNLTRDEAKKARESILKIESLKNEVEKLTSELSKREDMTRKYEAGKQKVLRERQCTDAAKVKAVELKKLAEEYEKRIMEEKSNSERLLQQVKEERQNVETLQKQVQELLSYDKSAHYLELKEAHAKLEIENKRLVKEKKHLDRVKAEELKTLAEEKDKKVMEERSKSKQLAQQMEMLQKQVQELLSTVKCTASGHSDYMEIKEAHTRLESQNRILIREKKRIEGEMGKIDEWRKLSEANEKKYFEEKCRADSSSHELEISKQKIKVLEEELCSLKHSKKLVGNSTVPDVNISTQNLLHEQLKLEKKRMKHTKQVLKLEKNRNNVLQGELGKLKQDFIRTVQHLDMLEKTLCGGTQAVDKSTKSSNLSKMESLYLNKMLFGSNQFGALENGLMMPGSSARRASGSATPTAVHSQLDNNTGSPSGITTTMHPLVGGDVRENSPSSPMDSSAASFPDKKLLGSQGLLVGSNATSTIVADGNPNQQAIILRNSDQAGKRENSAHVTAVVDNSMQTPHDSLRVNSKKRSKLLHEFESLKCVQSESRRLHQELEKKISKMHIKLNRLMPGQMGDAKFMLPDRIASQHDRPRKRRRASPKPEETLDHSVHLAKQIKRDKVLASTLLPPIKEGRSAQTCVDHISDQDTLLVFEQQIQGNVMKLLELDNEVDEELFRTAMGNLLSPTLPNINCGGLVGVDLSGCAVDENHNPSLLIGKDNMVFGPREVETNSKSKSCHPRSCSNELGTYKHVDLEGNKKNGTGVGFEQVGGGTTMSTSAPASASDCAKQTDRCTSGDTVETIPIFCILFSYMKDIDRIKMLLFATKRCIAQCFLHSETDRVLMELLTALAWEQQLTPREKVCIFFALTMYNFLQVSANESEGSSCSFPLYLCSVLFDGEKRGILAKSFCISEFLHLFENFIYQRKILFCGDKYTDANDITSGFDILLEGKMMVLYERTASTREVFAGSVIFSSVCLAVGQISILCDVSFNILQMWPADTQLILYILHGFAFVCGGKYFLTSNSSIQMEAVKSMVNVLENAPDVQGATLSQSNRKTSHQFSACTRCPFATSLQPLDILSMLIEELGKYTSMSVGGVDLSSSLSDPDYESNKDIYNYIDIMSSVELISIVMGWSWTTDKILPELQKLLPSSIQGNFSTSLVLLLGRLGRFGVKSCGYEDAGVKSIRQHLSSLLHQIPLLDQNHILASALYSALDGISLQNKENTSNSTFMRKCYSSMSSEKKCLLSALKQPTSQ